MAIMSFRFVMSDQMRISYRRFFRVRAREVVFKSTETDIRA